MNKSTIINIITQLLSQRNDVSAAYLFGSFVNEPVYNDIDLLILYNNITAHPFSDIEITCSLSEVLSISTDTIDLIPFELNKVNPFILIRAVTDGILIKDNDSNLLSEQLESLSQYFIENESCLYYRKKYLKEIYSND